MIAVTGANGYVGGRILAHLRARGLEPLALVRRPADIVKLDPRAGSGPPRARHYALAEPLAEDTLAGVDVVVHAAYDVAARGRSILEVNVAGSMPLVEALAARGGRVILISSLSAFDGARSLYGRSKLELEREVLARGGIALRPGLVFGRRAGGLFGAMSAALERLSVVPLPGGGHQRQFLTHDLHLAELVATLATDGGAWPRGPLFAAHEQASSLREIATAIAAAHGRRLRVVPLPARPVHVAMRAAETAGLALPFRSDSMLALMRPIPLDQLAALERAGVDFPPLDPLLWRS